MTGYDIIKIVFGIIASIGSAGAIIWFFVKLSANTLAEHYIEKVKHDLTKQLESYKSQLDVLKATTLKYNDRQFELYLDLWKNLQELKFASEDLWQEANKRNLKKFQVALTKSDRQIEVSSILIESNHYSELRQIISKLKEYDFGKQKLIESRDNVSDYLILGMIESNQIIKNRCLELIEAIKAEIQARIKGNQ